MDELKIGVIGGTGLADAFSGGEIITRHEIATPFDKPSDAIVETEWSGVRVFLLSRHGPGHVLNPTNVPYRANIFALKQLGVTHVIASGAVGSLREEMAPRDLVIADQVIDKTTKRSGTFFEKSAVHVEFSEPFCPVLRRILLEARPESVKVHDRGCYVAMEGPAFSSRAESLMHRLWGGELIGMTAMPEAKLAREAEMSYALVALVTDYDSWRAKPAATTATEPPDSAALLKEIIHNVQAASENAVKLIRQAVELMSTRRDELMAAPAQSALKMAIWSDKSKIDKEEVDRLRVLWGKYFAG